jgi:hypothetical protein
VIPLLGIGVIILAQSLTIFGLGRLLRIPRVALATALGTVVLKLSFVLLVVRWCPVESANSLWIAIVSLLSFFSVVFLIQRFWNSTYGQAALVGLGYTVFSLLIFLAGQHYFPQLPLQLF